MCIFIYVRSIILILDMLEGRDLTIIIFHPVLVIKLCSINPAITTVIIRGGDYQVKRRRDSLLSFNDGHETQTLLIELVVPFHCRFGGSHHPLCFHVIDRIEFFHK